MKATAVLFWHIDMTESKSGYEDGGKIHRSCDICDTLDGHCDRLSFGLCNMGEMAPISKRAMTSLSEMIAELDVRILALILEWALAAQRKGRAWFLGIHSFVEIKQEAEDIGC